VPITQRDLHQLIREPSDKVRVHIAEKVSRSFNDSQFTQNESKVAIDIFRLLLNDTETSVRKAIAENLKNNIYVPRDVLLGLANDEPEVSCDILEFSKALTDDDLIEIIRSVKQVKKWLAISRRQELSGRVSRHLVATHHEEVIASLLNNPGAEIVDSDISYLINEFRHDKGILEALVCRGGLNPELAERLFYLVSDTLKKQLTRRYGLSQKFMKLTIDSSRETAMLRFLSPYMSYEETMALVQGMHKNKRLTNSIIMNSLALGEVVFFNAAMAVRANIPFSNARTLLSDTSGQGFEVLYKKAEMPVEFYKAIQAVYKIAMRLTQNGRHIVQDYGPKLINDIYQQGYDRSIDGIEYFVNYIGQQYTHEPATFH
jgi:uncharacterized protein (DUF2336 family)